MKGNDKGVKNRIHRDVFQKIICLFSASGFEIEIYPKTPIKIVSHKLMIILKTQNVLAFKLIGNTRNRTL